ncbi:hypothetical protein [Benzoatithermus flavus]|uniref:Uncharacterized protein n=1 Tax=Benzoatithermus flavus TaxID=3108223 RepID=A0ABU8XPS1_9PROT
MAFDNAGVQVPPSDAADEPAEAFGRVNVAMYGQGRVPGRQEGRNLRSTSLAVRPGTDDLHIVTSDGKGGQDATIFHARAFANVLPLYSHRRRTRPARHRSFL